MGAPPDSEREGILGFDCLHRVAQSYLGPLWIAADVRDGQGTLGLLRRLALPPEVSDDARREIAALGRKAIPLVHPNVLAVREVLEQGSALVMVYASVEAEPLRSLQSWANLRGLSFPVGVALRVMVDLLDGLSALHELGRGQPELTVAGGLSPDSVLIARDGITQLSDPLVAGGAALIEGIGFNTAKLAYAAPEQVHAATAPTTRTDLFTCAAMLWELLASRRLLAGSRPAIERKLLEHHLPGLRASLKAGTTVSDELVATVERALSADPAERPESAAEFARLLGACGHEVASLAEVAAFVGKLSGPRFDRRTASIRSRSSGTLALDGVELARDLSKPSGGKVGLSDPSSEVDTPRADPPSERGSPPRPARAMPAHSAPGRSAPAGSPRAAAKGEAADPGALPPNRARPAVGALQSTAREAARRADTDAGDDARDLERAEPEQTSEPSSPGAGSPGAARTRAADTASTPAGSATAMPGPGTGPSGSTAQRAGFAAAAASGAPPVPFTPAPVEPPALGFAPVPGKRNPALWDQMVAPVPPAATHQPAKASLGAHALEGRSGPAHPALAASQPFANLTPSPFAKPKEGRASAPSQSPAARPAELIAPKLNDPFSVAAQSAAPSSSGGPLPFEHLLRSKRGPSQRPSVDPTSPNWFELHAPNKVATARSARTLATRPVFWVSLVAALAAPVAWYLAGRRVEAPLAPVHEPSNPPATAIAERPAPPSTPSTPPVDPTQPAAVAEATRANFSQPPVPAPSAANDAGAEEPSAATEKVASGGPRPAAADFAAAKLDDSQLVVLFALEEKTTLPTCAERLGDSMRKYSGNDMGRSMQQVKAAARKLADGDANAAHELACSAVAHSPRNAVAQRTLADLALALGDPAQAKAAIDRALAQTPKDKSLIAMRGDVLAVMGDIAGSRSIWLRNAVAKGSLGTRTKKLVNAYRKAGEKALAASNWADAVTYFRRAVVLTHGGFAPSLGLSEALLGLNHSNAALVWAERAARAFPKDGRIQVLFGDALHSNGQKEKARDAWQTALDVQPSNRVAARRLRQGGP